MTIVHPSITWTDAIGAATLTSVPLTFLSWTLDVNEIGDSQVPIGDRQTFFFAYRTDNIASFEVAQIPHADRALALRLKSHLFTGGSAVIHTEDSEGHEYTVDIAPGTVPDFQMTDTVERSYSLKLVVVNTEAGALAYTPSLHLRFGTLTVDPETLALDAGGSTGTVTATLTDSLGAPMVGFTINGVSNDESAFTVSPSSATSDSSGQVVFTVTPHVAGSGNVHAVAGSLIASVAVTVTSSCGWDEPFNQSDLATADAQYNAAGGDAFWSTSGGATGVSVSAGKLRLDGKAVSEDVSLAPPRVSTGGLAEFWLRVQWENVSGAYDDLGGPIDIEVFGSAAGVSSGVLNCTGDGNPTGSTGTYGTSSGRHSGGMLVQLGVPYIDPSISYSQTTASTIAPISAVGVHTAIICVSIPVAGTLKAEAWLDAAPGDAPGASVTVPFSTTPAFTDAEFDVTSPGTVGLSVEVDRVQIVCGNRASDPFGIL